MISFKNKKLSSATSCLNWHKAKKKYPTQVKEIPFFNLKTQVGITQEYVPRPLPTQMTVVGPEVWDLGFERENHCGEEVPSNSGGSLAW